METQLKKLQSICKQVNFNFLPQKNVNEMNKLKHGMVRDDVIMIFYEQLGWNGADL